jgi:hypothetical protein
VGCGLHDDAAAMVRLVVVERDGRDADVAFDLAGGAFGRGAHLHARPDCIARAPRGLARSFKRGIERSLDVSELARRLTAACDRRMAGLLVAARRLGALAIGADAALEALRHGAPLAIVAVDAGSSVADDAYRATHATHATHAPPGPSQTPTRLVAWRTKSDLGGLLGEEAVALCAVRHAGIAGELKRLRAAADAAKASAMTDNGPHPRQRADQKDESGPHARQRTDQKDEVGAECSRRPEVR